MPRHPKVLVAYDGSAPADAAFADLRNAGLGPKAEIRVLTVADLWQPPPEALYDGGNGWYASLLAAKAGQEKQGLKNAKALSEKTAQRLRREFPGWKITAAASLDAPASGILDEAKRWKASLILLGSLGHSALGRVLLGSVSHKVLNHAHCSVRITRPAPGRKPSPPRVLVAVDGSKDSEAALRAVAHRSWPKDAQFRVVTVLDYRLSLTEAFQAEGGRVAPRRVHGLPFHGSLAQHLAERAECALAEKGLRVDAAVREGDPRRALRLEAKRFRANALFLGSRGLGALQRFFLGSVSLTLAEHAPCTVEVIRR